MHAQAVERPVTLVWIDAREALIVRWIDDAPKVERLESRVPAHRSSAGHVRYDPSIRPGGGGGAAATSGDPRRLEHLARFLDSVAARLPEDDLELIGPGTVHEHLAQVVRAAGGRPGRGISTSPSGPLTEPQLVARLRHLTGHDPRRGGPGPRGRRALVVGGPLRHGER
jgi:hypothetical protein